MCVKIKSISNCCIHVEILVIRQSSYEKDILLFLFFLCKCAILFIQIKIALRFHWIVRVSIIIRRFTNDHSMRTFLFQKMLILYNSSKWNLKLRWKAFERNCLLLVQDSLRHCLFGNIPYLGSVRFWSWYFDIQVPLIHDLWSKHIWQICNALIFIN